MPMLPRVVGPNGEQVLFRFSGRSDGQEAKLSGCGWREQPVVLGSNAGGGSASVHKMEKYLVPAKISLKHVHVMPLVPAAVKD